MKKTLLIVMIAVMMICTACGGSSSKKEVYKLDLSQDTIDTSGLELKYGDLISILKTYEGDGVVIKTKIKSSYSNEATVNQNYHTVCQLITDNGFDSCSVISYWAVADMSNGEEEKVVAFDLSDAVIKEVKAGSISASELGDHADNLYIHQSLQ